MKLADCHVRRARQGDLETLDDLHTQCMKHHVERHYPWKPDLFRAGFRPDKYQVVEGPEGIVAFYKLVFCTSESYLAEMMVHPAHQRKGLGAELLRMIVDRCRPREAPLRLQVLKSNPARRFYERGGFRVVGEKPYHYLMQLG